MAFFKSTYNILVKVDEDEVFNENWMDSNEVVAPPTQKWTYDREMQIEDVDIWEVLYESGGGTGVYASWSPYAEYYLITVQRQIETFYGPNAQSKVAKRAAELGIKLPFTQVWVDQEDMWLHTPVQLEKKIIISGS